MEWERGFLKIFKDFMNFYRRFFKDFMNIEVIIERKFKIKISLVERERSWGNYVINFGYNDIEVLVERFDVGVYR